MEQLEVDNFSRGSQAGDWYSGEVIYMYSGKLQGITRPEKLCKTLVKDKLALFAVSTDGGLLYRSQRRVCKTNLRIETTIDRMGMKVTGHTDYIESNPGAIGQHLFLKSLDYLLSEKRFLNYENHPSESWRVFLYPLFIKMDGEEEYECMLPIVKVYDNGIVSLSLILCPGFAQASDKEVIRDYVNRANTHIESLCSTEEMYRACMSQAFASHSGFERWSSRKSYAEVMKSTLLEPMTFDLLGEAVKVYELIRTDQFSLSDYCRHVLAIFSRVNIYQAVIMRAKFYPGKQAGQLQGHWFGKPLLFIREHSNQEDSARKNIIKHELFANSVIFRTPMGGAKQTPQNTKDLRAFDDYNFIFTDAVSLVVVAGKLHRAYGEECEGGSFDNLMADIHCFNELSHFLQVFYSAAVEKLNQCRRSVDVGRIEVEVMTMEESLASMPRYGEISSIIREMMDSEVIQKFSQMYRKKLDVVRKGLELNEKILAEKETRRLTVVFGIIASATLSPELVQPLASVLGFENPNVNLMKIWSILFSFVLVFILVVFIKPGSKRK